MVLSLFDFSNKMRDSFISYGHQAQSLDILHGAPGSPVDIVVDFLEWDYRIYSTDHFKFIFCALPCTAVSRASGGFHFKNNIPKTTTSILYINLLIKFFQVTQYFKCPFIIENPTGGLSNNAFFKSFFDLDISRLTLLNFGFPTRKQTDLFHNFPFLLITPLTYRVNGRYQAQSLDNLSYRKRVTYPQSFCDYLVENLISQKII